MVAAPPDGDHEYENTPVPPVATTDAEPFADPQDVATEDVERLIADGSVIVTFCVDAQPLASETFTVYNPAERFDAVVPVPPAGDHEYVNGPVPPITFTDALPLFPPLHETPARTDAEIVGPPIFETAPVAVALHPLASVTVTV